MLVQKKKKNVRGQINNYSVNGAFAILINPSNTSSTLSHSLLVQKFCKISYSPSIFLTSHAIVFNYNVVLVINAEKKMLRHRGPNRTYIAN